MLAYAYVCVTPNGVHDMYTNCHVMIRIILNAFMNISQGRKDTQHQQFMEYAEIDIDNKKIEDKQQNVSCN